MPPRESASAAEVFRRGLAAYVGGQHYEAHEHWEELWVDEPDDDRSRFLQALIQVASAMHKVRHGVAPRGSLTLLERASERLATLPDVFMRIDVALLRADIARSLAALERALAANADLTAIAVPRIEARAPLTSWPPPPRTAAVTGGGRGAGLDRGLGAYRRGEYFEAHELWEQVWRDEPEGPVREGIQGLIQVAAAMYKALDQGKPGPAARLLERALLHLRSAPSELGGLRLDRLIAEAERARSVLQSAAGSEVIVPRIERVTASEPPPS